MSHDPTRIPNSWEWAIGQMFSVAFQLAVVFAVTYVVVYVIDHINWEAVWKP